MVLLLRSSPEPCDHVWLDVLRSDAAWRVVFAAHVFGRQESVGRGRTTWPGVVCAHQHKPGFRALCGDNSAQLVCKGDVSLQGCLRPSKPRAREVKLFTLPPLAVSCGALMFLPVWLRSHAQSSSDGVDLRGDC